MTTYYAYFRGGTKDGTTGEPYQASEPVEGLRFDGVYLDATELYFLTDETIVINGLTHQIYDLKA